MAKKGKLSTPDWILEGYDSEEEYNKAKGLSNKKQSGKTFKIRECPSCGSDEVKVVIGEVGVWQCEKCNWRGTDIKEEELTEEELLKYLDEKGEKCC